jgi:hypothetical protein
MQQKQYRGKLRSESGMTVIELLIAGVVLVVGMFAVMGLLGLAVGNNGRSKIDTTATMLSQTVVEQISAQLEGGGPGLIQDCVNPTPWDIEYQSAPPPNGWGAALNGDKIDFTQTNPPAGSFMNYVECNVQPNGNVIQTVYDVRWNVQAMTANQTYLVTVGARPKNKGPIRFSFALPVNMRVYVGGF